MASTASTASPVAPADPGAEPANDGDRPARTRRAFLGIASAAGLAAAAGHLAAPPVAGATGLSSSGAELGYAETTSSISTTSSRSVPGLVLSIATGDGPASIEYGGYLGSSVVNGAVKLYLMRDGQPVHEIGCSVTGAYGFDHVHGQCRVAPAQSTSVFSVLLARWTSSGAAHLFAGPLSPAFIHARRL